MAKKIVQTIQSEVLDRETGELLKYDSQKIFTEKINPDHFYVTFYDYFGPVRKLNHGISRKMLDWMCERAEFNTGIVKLTTLERQQMSQDLGIANNQITNNLKILKDLNIISGEKGTFKINSEIFWKGDLSIRRKEILEGKNLEISFKIVDDK